MITDENLNSIREITEILNVSFTGTTNAEAESFIRKYTPLANEMVDLVVLADKCYMDTDNYNSY